MATIASQTTSDVGADVVWNVANGGGDDFANTGSSLLFVKNDDASGMTITIVTDKSYGGLAVEDRTYAVGAGDIAVIGPFSQETYSDSTGKVAITYSSVTSLTVALIERGTSTA